MNALKKFALLATIPFVASCGPTQQPTATDSTQPQPVTYKSAWGDENAETIVGNLGVDIPYIDNEGFDVVLSEDNYGDPLVCIYVYEYGQMTTQDLIEDYAAICDQNNYDVTSGVESYFGDDYSIIQYEVYYADGWINDVDAIEIQFCEGQHNGKYAMGIFAFNYVHYDTTAWPTNIVNKVLGHDIPHFPSSDFSKYYAEIDVAEDGEQYAYVAIRDAWEDTEEEYKNLLIEEGYVIDDEDYDQYGYFAYPINGAPYMDHALQFCYSSGYGLEIYIVPLDYSSIN